MHGENNIKLITTQQARLRITYKNAKVAPDDDVPVRTKYVRK
jgi:phosphotransferase system IIB component